MPLKRVTRETLPVSLTLRGQGETVKFDITYRNLKSSEVIEMTESPDFNAVDTVLKMVVEWDAEYELSGAGLQELEDDRPGSVMAIIEGFHDARKVQRVKN